MSQFDEFIGDGLYYILCSFDPKYSLSIQNNKIEPYSPLIISIFKDSFYQAFYFMKNKEDSSYSIMNINSLKIIGIENINSNSSIIQNIISPMNNYRWIIKKTNNYAVNEYYIELKSNSNKRIDCVNNFVIINDKNDYNQSQIFKFKTCIYNVPKSDLWVKWEKYYLREFEENQVYIIRSAQNDNYVLNLNLFNNNISLKNFNGNKEEMFFIGNIKNNLIICPINKIGFVGKEYKNGSSFLKFNNTLFNLKINNGFFDYNGIKLYKISDEFGANLDISKTSNLLEFKQSNENISQKFYFSLVTTFVFKKYILQNLMNYNSGKKIALKYKFILEYDLDSLRNMNSLSIDKNTKYISDNVFRNMNNLTEIKINVEWINKFNKNKIISLELNDNISQLNLNLLNNFVNLEELHLPLSINNIFGKLNIPNLKKLECHPKLLKYFKGINLDFYIIHKEIKIIESEQNYPFENINSKSLILFKDLKIIRQGIFDYSSFKQIFCQIHHVKYLNKYTVSSIVIMNNDYENTIYSNTFENFINLQVVMLPKNIRKIESKGFNNCKNLIYIKFSENRIDIRQDSFFKCDKLIIEDEIKKKLEKFVNLTNKSVCKKM